MQNGQAEDVYRQRGSLASEILLLTLNSIPVRAKGARCFHADCFNLCETSVKLSISEQEGKVSVFLRVAKIAATKLWGSGYMEGNITRPIQ